MGFLLEQYEVRNYIGMLDEKERLAIYEEI